MAVNIGINIQRSPNRINQELRDAAVLGKFPKLFLDFKDEYYLANGGSKTFANAVTHARAGNATMTDGYGPELLTNGSFSDGTANWTANEGFTVNNGVATVTTTSGTVAAKIQQSFATEVGKTYILTLNLIARVPSFKTSINSSGFVNSGDLYSQNTNDLGRQSVVFTATTTTTYLVLIANTTNAGKSVSFDNVSVREMPVIKWAPHNLLTYSEDFTNGAYNKAGASVTADQATAPDGTTTADLLTSSDTTAQHQIQAPTVSFVSGQKYTNTWFVKSGTHDYVQVLFFTAAFGSNAYANFDLSTGATGTVGSAATASITDVGNDWYRLEVTADATTTATSRTSLNFITSSTASRNESWDADGTETVYIWGAHLYRSDLGGMVDNPDRGDSYVPTTSSALYLPRIGHHVYNGSAWVNEGVLAESKARINTFHYSQDFSNSYWAKSELTATADQGIAPDGTNTAFKLTESSTSSIARHVTRGGGTLVNSTRYTAAVYLKKGTRTKAKINVFTGAASHTGKYDIENGTVYSSAGADGATIENVGNGWFRCSITTTTAASGNPNVAFGMLPDDYDVTYDGDGSSYIYAWGATLETSSDNQPSSYIPTITNATVTRAAETFTIPSANLPWPEPQYIGSELITNGTFDTDTTGWTGALGATLSVVSGALRVTEDGVDGSTSRAYQSFSTVVGKVYQVKVDYVGGTGGSGEVYINTSTNFGGALVSDTTIVAGTTSTLFFVATATTTYILLGAGPSSEYNDYDNISVRQIDPLAVSIAVDGAMNFTDKDSFNTLEHVRWYADGNNFIRLRIDSSFGSGNFTAVQKEGGTEDSTATNSNYYSDGVLIPYDFATRNGSTFINGAVDGVELSENTTPTALPDLSSTDLNLAHTYMGTIRTFRIWDKDITDDGLVEATNPELEPSLSLTFEGSSTNSYVINDWSE